MMMLWSMPILSPVSPIEPSTCSGLAAEGHGSPPVFDIGPEA